MTRSSASSPSPAPVLGRAALEFMSATLPGTKDQWVHVMPAGDFSGRDGRGPYRLADAAGVIERSRRLVGPREIPVDYEHQTDRAPNNGQPAPAADWINALQARADGIWARVTWTDRAAAFLARREYRYFSPTFYHTPAREALTTMKGDAGRPLGIKPTLFVVPPSLEGAGRKILNSELGNGGETNQWKGTAGLLVTPWLG